MWHKIKNMEWNEWFNVLCLAGLVVTFVLTTWWMTALLWMFEWAVWIGWVTYMRIIYPKEIEQFFAHNIEKHFKK